MELIEKELSSRELMEKELGAYIEVKNYLILVKSVVLPDITKGGVILPDIVRDLNQRSYNIGQVLSMGPEAYYPPEKFPFGPACKIGDWVRYSAMERDPETINGHLCYFLTDQKIHAVIPLDQLPAVINELRVSNRGIAA
jgi:co-chaperonin GroES (HSP10)